MTGLTQSHNFVKARSAQNHATILFSPKGVNPELAQKMRSGLLGLLQ